MSTPREVVIVESEEGDWIGVYLDGRLAAEDHSISEKKMLEVMGFQYESLPMGEEHQAKGRLPYDIAELRAALAKANGGGR